MGEAADALHASGTTHQQGGRGIQSSSASAPLDLERQPARDAVRADDEPQTQDAVERGIRMVTRRVAWPTRVRVVPLAPCTTSRPGKDVATRICRRRQPAGRRGRVRRAA